jgi:hypothetical protein
MRYSESESKPIPISPTNPEFPRQLDIATASVYGLAILSAGMLMFLPLVNLLHPSSWQRSIGFIHSIAAMFTTIIVAYAGHLAFPLLRGSAKVLPQMRTLTFWATIITFLGIVTGNIAYMRYSADIETGGAKMWLKQNSPLTHYTFANYHELATLFALPLGVACSWILWQYGDAILEKHHRPVLTATCIALMGMMFFIMGGFVSGLAISKVHSL